MELALTQYLLLFFGAGLAGLVDSIAGGGGIISIPLLLSVGLPPHAALATNKLQGSFGSFTAMMRYRRGGLVTLRSMLPGILFTAAGAGTGALLVQRVPADILRQAIPFVLVALLVYTAVNPSLGRDDRQEKMPAKFFFLIFGLSIGFYDGFFGPGTGSFWTIAFAALAGFNLRKATAATKVMNFTSNIVALGLFLIGGRAVIAVGLLMAAGQVAGAWIGSHLVITRGTRFVRVIFLLVVTTTIVDLFIKQYG